MSSLKKERKTQAKKKKKSSSPSIFLFDVDWTPGNADEKQTGTPRSVLWAIHFQVNDSLLPYEKSTVIILKNVLRQWLGSSFNENEGDKTKQKTNDTKISGEEIYDSNYDYLRSGP